MLATGVLLALVPIVVQSTVLLLTVTGAKASVLAIRVWAGILLFGAAAYWASIFFMFVAGLADPKSHPIIPDKLTWTQSIFHVATMLFGTWFLAYARVARPVTGEAS